MTIIKAVYLIVKRGALSPIVSHVIRDKQPSCDLHTYYPTITGPVERQFFLPKVEYGVQATELDIDGFLGPLIG
jgi:hypothetical protein